VIILLAWRCYAINSFEKISSGNYGLDKVINYLRTGDNVVLQVDNIKDYIDFANSFARESLNNGKKVVYMRFAEHRPILEDNPEIKKYTLNASRGFETFTVQVHNIIENEGAGAYYVFDCLSNLLQAWATDLMIGNFFCVTCPYLYDMDTIAYFAILRSSHSFETVARIRETTQLLLDVYDINDNLYVHPLKVWNRYSPTMFLPHIQHGGDMIPITSSSEAAKLFLYLPQKGLGNAQRHLDYWDKLFIQAEELILNPPTDPCKYKALHDAKLEQLCRLIIGKDKKILELAKKYFTLEDILNIKSRLIGSGFIGGKAVGMLLARQVLLQSKAGEWNKILEPHDSFYIGSDIFYTYIVQNGWWQMLLKQRKREGYFEVAETLRKNMQEGVFTDAIKEKFWQMLEYFGQSPIIVRSSSLLEDGFGNAFAGKYESVFCVNQGTPSQRYEQFENALRTVYASSMNKDALTYRIKRGLDKSDEQMAVLVQRVSGDYHKKYFFPLLGGVGFSYNNYVWKEGIDAKAGMLRLVLGLGTRAVNRIEGDYPRVVSLDNPTLQPLGNTEDRRKFSQHEVDVLNLEKNTFETVHLYKLMWEKTGINMDLFGIPDHETNRKIREYGIKEQEAWILTFENLFKNTEFIPVMKKLLYSLERAYDYPVDVEFTVNLSYDNTLQINLVQCRPLQTKGNTGRVNIPDNINERDLIFSSEGRFMGGNIHQVIKRFIYVDPENYGKLPECDKYAVARLIGQINKTIADREDMPVMLISPGRLGTSTASLGVPATFSEISNFLVICETASEIMGVSPDLSYGSHFFQDLVENDIFYVSLFPNMEGTRLNTGFFNKSPSILKDILPEESRLQHVVKVIDTGGHIKIAADIESQRVICYKTL